MTTVTLTGTAAGGRGVIQFGHGDVAVDDPGVMRERRIGGNDRCKLQFGHGDVAVDGSWSARGWTWTPLRRFNSATATSPWMTPGGSHRAVGCVGRFNSAT